MGDPWQVLRRAGLPLGLPDASLPSPALGEIASAVRVVLAEPLPAGRERDALSAFILAWCGHFPSSFESALGENAGPARAWADAAAVHSDRYLKLRRIAVAHLAGVL